MLNTNKGTKSDIADARCRIQHYCKNEPNNYWQWCFWHARSKLVLKSSAGRFLLVTCQNFCLARSTVSDVHPIYIIFLRLCTIWFWGCLLRFFLLEVHANNPHKFVSRLDGAASAAASRIQDPWRGSERIRMVANGKLGETRGHHRSVAVPFLSPCFMNRLSNADRATAGHVMDGRKIGVFVILSCMVFSIFGFALHLLRFFHSIYPPISITHSFATSLDSPSETLKMASIAC